VICAQSIAAFHNGFRADPGGSSDTAAALGDRHVNRARQALTKIAATPATTPKGLCSKARIVPVVFKDNQDGCLLPADEAFLISFGADVHKFLQPICDSKMTLQSTAPEGGAS
jgi:hypothetical protein